jgi:hypothetical protein
MMRNGGLCTDLLGFVLQLRNPPKNLNGETFDDSCVTSHRLKWDPLPTNEIDRITQDVVKGEGGKYEDFDLSSGVAT